MHILDLYWDSCKCRNYWKEGIHALFVISDSNLWERFSTENYRWWFLWWRFLGLYGIDFYRDSCKCRNDWSDSIQALFQIGNRNLWERFSVENYRGRLFFFFSFWHLLGLLWCFLGLFFLDLHWDSCKCRNYWSDSIQALFQIDNRNLWERFSVENYRGRLLFFLLSWRFLGLFFLDLHWDSCKCRNDWSDSIQRLFPIDNRNLWERFSVENYRGRLFFFLLLWRFLGLFFLDLHWDSCKCRNDWSDSIQALFQIDNRNLWKRFSVENYRGRIWY